MLQVRSYNRKSSSEINVIALNVPGFDQAPSYWPQTVLRESEGHKQAREVLLSHPETKPLLRELQKALIPSSTQAFFEKYSTTITSRLECALSGHKFKSVRRALHISDPERVSNTQPGEFWDLFDSQHIRYDAESYAMNCTGRNEDN